MRVSNSKANTYRRCPKKYDFKYNLGLRAKKKGLPLTRGDWLHQMLMEHYDGNGWIDKWKELRKGFATLFEEEREGLGDLPGECRRIMRAYERRYEADDKNWIVIDSEVDELVELPNGDYFNFIIDLIVEHRRTHKLELWDHKTVKSFMDADFMLLDTQLARYYWGAKQLGYSPIAAVGFNELCTKPPTIPQLLKSGVLSQRKNLASDSYTYMAAIKQHGLNPSDYSETLQRLARRNNDYFRRTKLPKDTPVIRQQMRELMQTTTEIKLAERAGRYPRTVSKNCKWDCEFKDLCITDLHGGNIESQIKMSFDVYHKPQILEVD